MQFYDPHTLISEVQELLRSYGLNPRLIFPHHRGWHQKWPLGPAQQP